MNTKRTWVAAAAVVAVVAVGIGWGLASDGSGRSGSNGPGAVPGLSADDPGTDGDQPGGDGAADDGGPAAGSAPDSGSDSGSGSGSRSGSAGGAAPDNQPPVIEDPGLSSDGLLLQIAPTVTDPEGDDVSLLFEIDGHETDPATTCFEHPTCKGEEDPSATPTKASAVLDHTEVGYEHDAMVTIIATDGRGATSRQTFTHELVAKSTVAFRDLRFTVGSPEDCFREESSRSLSYKLDLSGAIMKTRAGSGFPTNERTRHYFLVRNNAVGFAGQPPALLVDFSASLEGVGSIGFAAPRQYSQSEDVVVPFYTSHDCRGQFSYRIQFIVK